MQINIKLDKDNVEQAMIYRTIKYPNTTVQQIRDSFIFNECIDNFYSSPSVLISIIDRDKGKATVNRMITIKPESYERLKTIAEGINRPISATYRAIIALTVENLDKDINIRKPTESEKVLHRIIEKVTQLEQQLGECNKSLEEIKLYAMFGLDND